MSTVHLLGNPASRSRRGRVDPTTLVSAYGLLGCEVVDLTGSTTRESSDNLAAAVRSGEIERLIVAGGDGLVHLAIQHLGGTAIPVGLLPSGTGNDFASALGITERDLNSTLGPTADVDLIVVEWPGLAEHTWIASIGIIGFPAEINARANRMNAALGPALYTLAAALQLPSFERSEVALNADGELIETDTAMLAIGNTRFFGGGMLACPDAQHDDGMLHVTSIQGVGRIGILRHLMRKSGGSADRPEVLRLTAKRIDIATPHLELWGDGEPIGATPLTLRIVPGALAVAGVAPATSRYDGRRE